MLRLRIEGRVQGVGFRYWVVREARALGLRGWVRNRADGSVEAMAAGAPDALDAFVAACRKGPRGARVDVLQTSDVDVPVEDGFGQIEDGP